MAFSCLPTTVDPRVKLLKQATITGMPARSRDSERTISTMSRTQSTNQSRSNISIDKGNIPPPPPLPPDTLEELLSIPLAVDIATVFDEENEDSASTVFNPQPEFGNRPAANSVGSFTRRAFVAQGTYRVGWMIDSERTDCSRCRRRFGAMNRRHHCRGCGDVFCGECTKYRSSVPCLIGHHHRVCGHCFEKVADQISAEANMAVSISSRRSEPCLNRTQEEHQNLSRFSKSKEI